MTKGFKRPSIVVLWAVGIGFILAGTLAITMAQADEVPAAVPEAQQKAISTNLGIYGGDNWDIAVDGDHVYTIASGVPNGFFYSTDAAATWQRPAGTYDLGSGTAVEVDPATHTVFVALDGVYKSTDYGATLTQLGTNMGSPMLFAQGKLFTTWNDTTIFSSDNGATFTHVAIAAGENIMSYAASKTSGTFYAVTRNDTTGVAKLYVTTDGGTTWAAVSVDASVSSFTNVNADPYDANIITLSGDNALWLSTNAGSTWTNIGTSASRPCGNYSVWTSSKWYACSGYSTNNGSTWTDMDVHTNVMRGPGKTVVVNSADETVLYGDCMSGVCKSTNGGLTWSNSLNGITGVNVLAISYTTDKTTAWISSSNGLAKTTNFNAAVPTWTWPVLPCDPLTRCDSSGIGESVWVKPDDANIVLAGSIGGWVYRSTDAGTTWTGQIPSVVNVAKFKSGDWNNLRPRYFLTDPANTSTVYLALIDPVDHKGAVLKSVDAGVTWTDLAISDDAPATVLSMTTSGIMYAGTGEGKPAVSSTKGIYKYENGTWTKLTGIDTQLNINSILVDPETQTTVYATASNDLAPQMLDGFFKSTDSGATWTKLAPAGYLRFGAITVQKNTTPNTLYLTATDYANHGIMLKSSDQGASWGLLYQGLKSETFNSVVFDGLVVGSKHGLIGMKTRSKMVNLKFSANNVKKNKYVTLTGNLIDGSTRKALANKTVGMYRLNGTKYVLIGTIKTDKNGKFTAPFRPQQTTKYVLNWWPDRTDRHEYAAVGTLNLTLTVKK